MVEWLAHAKYNWQIHARPSQIIPQGYWSNWVILAGRGWGKTAVGSQAVREHVHRYGYRAIGLIAATASDARDTMIDGKGGSSLLEVSPPEEGLEYFPTKRRLTWKNGAVGHSYSAEEPERLRGPQHDFLWMDELATWRYLQETWDQATFGLRLGANPKRVITTTPRPLPLLSEILRDAVPVDVYMKNPDKYKGATVLVRGATMENAENLAPQFLEELKRKYEGTRLGRQEIYAEILDDNPNALFRQMKIDENRVDLLSGLMRKGSKLEMKYRLSQGAERPQSFKTELSEIIVSVDPSMSSDVTSDETGIIVQATDDKGSLFVIEDASGIMTPNDWARTVLRLYQKYDADAIVAEVNQGGDLVENTIRTAEKEMGMGRVNYRKVRAQKGKHARAEPVGALEEQGRIHHVGDFPKLEEQLTTFQPGYQKSPDRLDAYVWGAHHLIIQKEKKGFFIF